VIPGTGVLGRVGLLLFALLFQILTFIALFIVVHVSAATTRTRPIRPPSRSMPPSSDYWASPSGSVFFLAATYTHFSNPRVASSSGWR
jgi:hypothetical protein